MPSHRVSIQAEPHIVMHEDDPVLTKRWNKVTKYWTRQNVKRVAWVFGVVTLALLLFNQALVINLYNGLERERRDRIIGTDEAICSLIDLVPPGNVRVDAQRDKYKCGPYVPGPGDPSSISPSSPRSAPSASTPNSTATVTQTGTVTLTSTGKALTSTLPPVTITKTSVIPNVTLTKLATVTITVPLVTITVP